ncbi:MAG: hypothetical protein APF80_00380 [Alphaproteobacteria bacterium BRH_c36]|nr:MAG: hypothetical protein APF80_00380 [Alphaproteobacteria bacterium BRH_c36]
MLRTLLASIVLVLATATGAWTQNVEIIKQRQELLDQMGKAAKGPGQMMKQEIPFDEATVQAALDTIIANAAKLPELFPDDSRTGGETEALPAIWENKADVMSRYEKLVADAQAAKVAVSDEFEFMETWPKVAGNCGGCHKKYRVEKK